MTREPHHHHPCSSYSSLPDFMAKKEHRCKFDIGMHERGWGNGRVGQQRSNFLNGNLSACSCLGHSVISIAISVSKSGASPESMPDCKDLDGRGKGGRRPGGQWEREVSAVRKLGFLPVSWKVTKTGVSFDLLVPLQSPG